MITAPSRDAAECSLIQLFIDNINNLLKIVLNFVFFFNSAQMLTTFPVATWFTALVFDSCIESLSFASFSSVCTMVEVQGMREDTIKPKKDSMVNLQMKIFYLHKTNTSMTQQKMPRNSILFAHHNKQ